MKNGAVIIPAAGSGTRMKLNHPKQYHVVAGAPILIHTITAFLDHPCIAIVVVVVPADFIKETANLLAEHRIDSDAVRLVSGGIRRQDSVLNGLKSLDARTKIVLIHDGARPLVSKELITACYNTARQDGAAIAAVPVKDTLKRATPEQTVAVTVNREDLWQAQTPQAARYDLLVKAYQQNGDADVTDESTLLERAGIPVTIVEGAETNIKITRPEDLILAQTIMQKMTPSPRTLTRIGHGFDAHQLVPLRKLILAGIEIPYELGLAGHSDADVVTHALCDALLGAIGVGDIGRHFPDSSAEFKDIYSITLLERVMRQVKKNGFELGNADITIICQAPKLASYIPEMQSILATACNSSQDVINIKATTTEKMGFTGRGEGISCHAVVLLHRVI